ncbi:concanavalin A-like lectin/glucanase [Pholiota conissans]|uniref:Concanavalin A-like lectin/glucanase n=1 Tax=Pholiota conissans TaxID=109636 RepID=A0A9P5Z2H7_9AGAR|nr:concanavalin A-like lectin/glucanase [Pholiota conissans]
MASATVGDNGGSGSSTASLIPRSTSNKSLYKSSAAAAASSVQNSPSIPAASEPVYLPSPTTSTTALPRNASTHSFRAPFLAPSSRPTSSLWSPPSYPTSHVLHHQTSALASPSASATALGLTSPYLHALPKARPPPPSTRLATPLTKADKPWLATRAPRSLTSYFITLFFIFLGLAGAAFLCFSGFESAQKLILDPNSLCLVMSDDFTGGDLDSGSWVKDVELGGFGVGEFDMSTGASDNLYLKGGELYFMPTLTPDNIVNGGNYTLPGCTSTNKTACSVTSSRDGTSVVNPVMSARINTKGKKSIKFGKVEIRAKMPVGDWLVPQITLSPVNNTYGAGFPLSGQMTLAQSRGNGPTYPAQGRNFVTASLVYGPLASVAERIFGWYSLKRSTFADDFHVYTLEWTPAFIRTSVDTRSHTTLLTTTTSSKTSYWTRGHFPQTAQNGSTLAVVQDIYSQGGNAAPFDQDFYLGVGLGVGGTSGWFPDNLGGKMWFDGSVTAMRDFARARDAWYSTWPAGEADRAFRIDYVKMWEMCK